jgi:hypothetical protein
MDAEKPDKAGSMDGFVADGNAFAISAVPAYICGQFSAFALDPIFLQKALLIPDLPKSL